MEGKRVEGVLLDTAIARNKASEAYETAKTLQIKILSKVPESLLAVFTHVGSRIKAQVREASGGRVLLILENGYEIEAQNKLSIPIKEGDELILSLEKRSPPTLKVEQVISGLKSVGEVLRKVLPSFSPPADTNLEEFLGNSGLIYEKKVWDYLRGARELKELLSDQKYKVLSSLSRVDMSLLEEIAGEVGKKNTTGQAKDTLSLLQDLNRIEKDLATKKNSLQKELNRLISFVEQVVKGFVKSLARKSKLLGLELNIREEVLANIARSPKSLDILQESLKSLEMDRFEEFRSKLSLIGLNVKESVPLSSLKEGLLVSLKDYLKGARLLLNREFNIEDFKEMHTRVKKLEEEIRKVEENLLKLKDVHQQARESLSKLEAINYLQSFLIANGGRSFLVPFSFEDGKGIMAFSKRETFRVFIKLNLEGGFLGVMLEAPRNKSPESLAVVFKTDIPQLEKSLSLSVGALRKELEELGLKVKTIKVLSSKENEFEEELVESLGEDKGFNLRV